MKKGFLFTIQTDNFNKIRNYSVEHKIPIQKLLNFLISKYYKDYILKLKTQKITNIPKNNLAKCYFKIDKANYHKLRTISYRYNISMSQQINDMINLYLNSNTINEILPII